MRKLSLLTSVVTTGLLSAAVFANPAEVPKETLISLTDFCTKAAAEEQIEYAEEQQFVSDCVNAQLIEMGYQRQSSLVITDLVKDDL